MKLFQRLNRKVDLLRSILAVGSAEFLEKPGYPLQYHPIGSVAEFIDRHRDQLITPRPWKSLDLGSGCFPQNPFQAEALTGVDIKPCGKHHILQADLFMEPIPCDSSQFDFVTAFDFIEHIPRVVCTERTRFPFIELMDEVFRVLKPGGVMFLRTPAFPSKLAFQDPTHVNIITEDTLPAYFCGDTDRPPWGGNYGFRGGFRFIGQAWSADWTHGHLLTLMQKPDAE